MLCLGILWNCMENNFEEAKKDISKYGDIIDVIPLNLEDKYETFVRDIYSVDDIATWKVDKKLETMFSCTNSKYLEVLIIDIKTDSMYYHPLKKRMVYTKLEGMKTDIRKKYSEKIPNYFFDNVFHVTDDENEFKNDYEILKKYLLNDELSKKNYLVKKKEKKQ